MKIAVFSAQPCDRQFLEERFLRDGGTQLAERAYHAVPLTMSTLALAQQCRAVSVFVNDQLDADVLGALSQMGVGAILMRCTGFNNLDTAAAARLGLFVARVPAYPPEAVAEHSLALILTLNRHTHQAYARVRDGNFALEGLIGSNLHGKTVGLVGVGKIGMAAARIFHGFGCHVLGCDPLVPAGFEQIGTMATLPDLLAASDIVSLHCPLLPSTRHMIDRAALARMKQGAMLVNTSRGGLVDTRAVIDALKAGKLGALAIDVYEQESALFFQDRSAEVIADDVFARLMTFPNVLVTGHQGFFTVEAMRDIADVTVHNLACFVNALPCENLVPGTSAAAA